jgi:hypothetical protein
MTQDMRFLVVIETQKVKLYLFASPIMRETRGASVRLDWLNRNKTKKVLEDEYEDRHETIYLGGGSGRILFGTKSDALSFKDKILQLYRDETSNAKVSVEVVPKKEGEEFSEWMRRGVRESQQNKLGRVERVAFLAGRWIRPCSSCGVEAAETVRSEFGEHWLCQSCRMKRDEINTYLYRKVKPGEGNLPRPLKDVDQIAERYTENFIFVTLARHAEERIFLPQTFAQIGDKSRPKNYMGFIYADGNRMGEVVKHLGDRSFFSNDAEIKQAYKAFSEIVDRATREAAVEAVLEILERFDRELDEEKGRFLPAEFIIAGGDDLMLAVPAHNALDVAVAFMEKFQEKSRLIQEEYVADKKLAKVFAEGGLTTSAGVVLSHASYPASDLMTLSADLMKLAKRKAADMAAGNPSQETGTLDFMVLSESGTEPVKERRKREYVFDDDEPVICRTERPYTTADARKLLNRIRAFKASRLPRTKLKALYPVLFQSHFQAQFDALRIKDRLKKTGDLEEGGELSNLIATLHYFPFRPNDSHNQEQCWTTPMTEIIELYDFIKEESNNVETAQTPEKEAAHG